MKALSVSGTAWIALMSFLATWLTDTFNQDIWWVPVVVSVLYGAIRFLEVLLEKEQPVPMSDMGPGKSFDRPSKPMRWLFGS